MIPFFLFWRIKMRYCAFCKRINPGRPLYCQFCGRTFWARICRHCRQANPREALVCRNCGSAELSETSGSLPFWMDFIKVLFWILILTLIIGIIRSLELLLPLFVIIGLLCLGFFFAPPAIRKLLKMIFKYFWILIIGRRNNR